MKISSAIITTLFAGIAGVIAGTLLAPNKGTKTRGKISRKGHQYKDYLVDNFNDFTSSVVHPFEKLEDQTKRLSEKALNKAKKINTEVKHQLK